MLAAPIPNDEETRLELLARYEILDSSPEIEFDALTRLAARILDVPIVLVSIVDADRQWFKARFGLNALETPRDVSFCGHVVFANQRLIVPDAWIDPRFADNPLVTGAPHVRFYAGIPLRSEEGAVLGTFCAIDHQPRELTAEQVELLEVLAHQTITLLTLRRRNLEYQHAEIERERLAREIRTVMDQMPAMIGYWDKDLRNRHANKMYFDWFGVAPETMRGMHIRDLVGEELFAANLPHIQAALRGEAQSFYREIVDPSGNQRYSQASYVPDVHDGEVRGFFVLVSDITERREIERALFAEKETARITLGAITEAVVTADAAGLVVYVNPVAERLTGWSQDAARGQPIAAVLALRAFSGQSAVALLSDALAGRANPLEHRTTWLLRRDGSQLALRFTLSSLLGPEGAGLGVVMVGHDVSEARAQAIKLAQLAHHDALTGLPNRLLLEDRLEQAVEDARRTGTHFAVLFIGLDVSTAPGASPGPQVSDELFRLVAHRIRSAVSVSDTASRFGTGEFVVLLAEVADEVAAEQRTARLMNVLREPLQVGAQTLSPTLSCGLSLFQLDEAEAHSPLRRAEAAMHEARNRGH